MAQTNFRIISHKVLQLEFSKQSLSHFWVKTRNECPVISDLVTHNLLDFCIAYMCEAAFSKLKVMKCKIRSFMKNVGNALRPALSCINLRMDNLCKNHQIFPSHQPPKTELFFTNCFRLTVSITWQFYYRVDTFVNRRRQGGPERPCPRPPKKISRKYGHFVP